MATITDDKSNEERQKTNDKSDDPVFPPLGHDPVYEHRGTHT